MLREVQLVVLLPQSEHTQVSTVYCNILEYNYACNGFFIVEFFKSTNGIIVISSIAVVFLVIVAVVIIVVVIIVVLRKKKSSGYSFQRMSMRNVQEDDGEVET